MAPPSCRVATALPLLCPGLTGLPGLEASPSPASPFLPLRGAWLNCIRMASGCVSPWARESVLLAGSAPGNPLVVLTGLGEGRPTRNHRAGTPQWLPAPQVPLPYPLDAGLGWGGRSLRLSRALRGLGVWGTGSCGAWRPWRPPPGRPRRARVGHWGGLCGERVRSRGRVGPWFRLLWVPRLVGVGPRGRPLRPMHQHLPRDLERGLAPRGSPVRTRAGAAHGPRGPWNRDASALRQPRGVRWRGDRLHGRGLVGPRARGRCCVPPEDPLLLACLTHARDAGDASPGEQWWQQLGGTGSDGQRGLPAGPAAAVGGPGGTWPSWTSAPGMEPRTPAVDRSGARTPHFRNPAGPLPSPLPHLPAPAPPRPSPSLPSHQHLVTLRVPAAAPRRQPRRSCAVGDRGV